MGPLGLNSILYLLPFCLRCITDQGRIVKNCVVSGICSACKLTSRPATSSQMLAEDIRVLGQRQIQKILLFTEQEES